MTRIAVELVLALAAGAAGGFLAVHLLAPRPEPAPGPTVAEAGRAGDLRERIEALEARAREAERASLTGHPEPKARLGDLTDEDRARLVEALEAPIREKVEAQIAEIVEREGLVPKEEKTPKEPPRRRVPLAVAASELGMSSGQEAALRQIYQDYENRLLDLMAPEGGDRSEVMRDIEHVKANPSSRMQVMQKYLPRVMKKLPELMTAEMDKQVAIQQTMGDLTDDLQKYDIEESKPFGLGDGFQITASASASTDR